MSTASDHAATILSAIIPNRRDLLDLALRHLTPEHFPDMVLRNTFIMLERYSEVTGAIMTRDALADQLGAARADPGKVALYLETYDLLHHTATDEAAFRWSLTQIRELAADRATGEALTQAMEILTRGAQDERGQDLKGHADARTHVLQRFAEIDRSLSMQESPEGDMRTEGDDILADYAAREAAKRHGRHLGVDFGIPALDERLSGLQPGELVLCVGYTSEGKSNPVDVPVLTPTGWRRIGDLAVGDQVVDPEGAPSQVAGVYPQGVLPVYRLTFSDGSTAEASGDHLWAIRHWKPVKSGGTQTQQRVREVWTTDQLRARVASPSRNPALVEAPGLASLDFPESALPVDPYLLGVLLGDGHLGSTPVLTFGAEDAEELAAQIRDALPAGIVLREAVVRAGAANYSVVRAAGLRGANPLSRALGDMGLRGCRSWEKFVPEQYKWASAKTRLAVLQGLMDTDGGHERGRAKFSSASERLRDDVVWLARSLGLRAAVLSDKTPYYTHNGERRQGRTAYRCAIWEKPELRVFRLARKQGPIPARDAGRVIQSVEYVRDAECVCIAVSAPSRLFVTNDFIPTHNTSLIVQLAWHAAVVQGRNAVVLTTETVRNQVRRRIIARHSCQEAFGVPGGLNSRDIKNGTLDSTEKLYLHEVVRDFAHNPGYGRCYIVQVPRGATVGYLESKLVRIQRMFPVDIVVMDYLALLKPERRRNTLREELGSILTESKQFATTFNDGAGVPFVSPWQVSRTARQEAERLGYYTSSALSETAEASNSADIIVSLLAPLDTASRTAKLKMQIMKNRDGEKASSIEVGVDYATSRFSADVQRTGGGPDLDAMFAASLLG